MTLYRKARSEDLGRIIPLCVSMQAETEYMRFPINMEKLESFILGMTDGDDGFVLVAERGEDIVGLFIGCRHEMFFSDLDQASEMLFYVAQSARGSIVGKRMIQRFEEWALEHNCARVLIGVSSGVNTDRTEALLGKIGFKAIGGFYAKDRI